MLSFLLALLCFLPVIVQAQYRFVFGPTYGFHNLPTNTHILSASTTLFPSSPPSPQKPRLALWAGMDTTKGHLVQAVVVSSPEYRGICGTGMGEWCVFASVLAEGEQRMGRYKRVGRGKGVGVRYVYNDTTKAYDQDVSIDGDVVSRLSYKSGLAKNFYTEVECQDEHRGAVSAHKYINTTIVLANPDPEFGKRIVKNGTSARDVRMEDGGRIWKIPRIDVEGSEC